jgi:hypothetical protein
MRAPADHKRLSEEEIFAAFFSQVTNDEMTEEEVKIFADTMDKLRRTEREAH